MSDKRDNAYWQNRLEKDGKHALLEDVRRGKVTVYAACVAAGYRKGAVASLADTLHHHWTRASKAERLAFATREWDTLAPLVRDLRLERKAQKAEKGKKGRN